MRCPPLPGLLLALALAPALTFADDTVVRVTGTNLNGEAGNFVVWVYDSPDTWLSDNWRTQKILPLAGNVANGEITVELRLPPGEYALSVWHDTDDDGKLARNFVGLPKEPAGLSNNVRPRFGPPRFRDARFTVGDTPVEQRIKLD